VDGLIEEKKGVRPALLWTVVAARLGRAAPFPFLSLSLLISSYFLFFLFSFPFLLLVVSFFRSFVSSLQAEVKTNTCIHYITPSNVYT